MVVVALNSKSDMRMGAASDLRRVKWGNVSETLATSDEDNREDNIQHGDSALILAVCKAIRGEQLEVRIMNIFGKHIARACIDSATEK